MGAFKLVTGAGRSRRNLVQASLRIIGAAIVVAAAGLTGSGAWAACAPAAGPGPGTPASGTTVTCSGTTTNQNAPAGYGTGGQNGLTINVVSGASVIGTNDGFSLDGTTAANTINNSGTVSDDGSNPALYNGVSTLFGATITVTNNPTGSITGTSSAANAVVIGLNVGNLLGSNAGSISATATGSANEIAGVNAASVNFTNTGTIAASGSAANGTFGILALNDVTVTNSGTISANGGTGATGTAIASNTGSLTVTNQAGGLITGTETGAGTSGFTFGILAAGTGAAIITNNAGATIHGDDLAIGSLSTTSNTIVNAGTISGGGSGAIRFFGTASSSVENGGVITETAGAAIRFAGSNNVLTLDPGSSITGNVVATGADTFQLGGTGTASFDASTIGPAAQYQGFSTFNKIGDLDLDADRNERGGAALDRQRRHFVGRRLDCEFEHDRECGRDARRQRHGGQHRYQWRHARARECDGQRLRPLTVQGSLVFTAASSYLIQVTPANAGRTNVTGTATLANATVNAIFAAGAYVSKQYVIVNATGGVTGTLARLSTPTFPPTSRPASATTPTMRFST